MLCMYDKVYLKSVVSIIKILQSIVLLIAFASVLSFDLEVIFVNTVYSRIRFFVLVSSVGWFTCVLIFILNITRLTRNLPIPWHWVNLIIGVIFALFLLISAALLSNNINAMKNTTRMFQEGTREVQITECDIINRKQSSTSCSVAELGAVFGFIAVALFVADVVVAAQKLRRGDYSHDNPVAHASMDNATVSSVVQWSTICLLRFNHKVGNDWNEMTQRLFIKTQKHINIILAEM